MDSQLQKHIKYINGLQLNGGYRFSQYSDATSLSTAFSVMSLFALNATDELLENKKRVSQFLVNKLNEKHEIIDDKYFLHEIKSKKHDTEYVINQSTFFSYIALDILGVTFDKLEFISPFYDSEYLKVWFKKRLTGNFWAESNKLMFLFYFFAYTLKYGNSSVQASAKSSIKLYFSLLEQTQNRASGYWGGGKSLHRKAYGAAHLYLFYDYFGKEIPYVNEIIDATLPLHARNGLAETMEGGACEDYDLVEIYLRVMKQTDYKAEQVMDQLVKMRETIFKKSEEQGGFSYKFFRMAFGLQRLLPINPPVNNTYSYSSLRNMTTPVYYPDSWATLFRILSLNAINLLIDKKEVPSYDLPGWGFLYRK